MTADYARRRRLELQRQTGHVMCTGWRFSCACHRHGVIFDRYEAALRLGEHEAAQDLHDLIVEQARTLAKT